MNGNVISLRGARVLVDGELLAIVELDAASVTIRNERRGQFSAVTLGRLVAGCTSVEPVAQRLPAGSVGIDAEGVMAGCGDCDKVRLLWNTGRDWLAAPKAAWDVLTDG